MRRKQTAQPSKARKAKRAAAEPSQATILRREKKALVALEQLEALEKHREEIAEVETQPPPFDAPNEVKALRGMVGTCLAQLAALEKVVVGLQ